MAGAFAGGNAEYVTLFYTTLITPDNKKTW